MLRGTDLSHYQGNVDWDAIKATVDFAIVKATEGSPDPGQTVEAYEDQSFRRNQVEMRRVGILHGFYHFARPDFNDPESEAVEFVSALGPLQEGEVLFLDFEHETTKDIVDWCRRWLAKVEDLTGNKALVYLNESLVNSQNWSPVFNSGHGLWVAKYGVNDGTVPGGVATGVWPTAAFWQYSSVGTVAGIHPVDLDNFYGDREAFLKYGYHAPVSPAPSQTAPAPDPVPIPAPPTDSLQGQLDAANANIANLTAALKADLDGLASINAKVAQLVQVNKDLVAQNDSLRQQLASLPALPSQKPVNLQDVLSLIVRLFTKHNQ